MRIRLLVTILLFSIALGVSAQRLSPSQRTEVVSAYRQYKDVAALAVSVPIVVEVPFAEQFLERVQFAVYDQTTNTFEPSYVRQESLITEIPLNVTADAVGGNAARMIDGNTKTYAEFILPETAPGKIQMVIAASQPVIASGLTLLLDNHVALPTSVGIRAVVGGAERIVVADRRVDQTTVRFPRTESAYWTITLTFAQPLRVAELRLMEENVTSIRAYHLRFLARPGRAYRVYFDPDRNANPPVGEAGNLALNDEVLVLPPLQTQSNPQYRMADVDGDGIADARDNCVEVSNRDQKDVNHNGRGDACDDFDRDGVFNNKDNCPDNANRSQADTDGDGAGDACDEEESRITERLPWLPWVGIGFAALVVIILLIMTARMPANGKAPPQRK